MEVKIGDCGLATKLEFDEKIKRMNWGMLNSPAPVVEVEWRASQRWIKFGWKWQRNGNR